MLSNILLNELDQELMRRGLRFVRYADDCSIFLRSLRSARRVKRSITRFIEWRLRLKVNEEKTGIRRPVHFELLGYGFVPTYRKGERGAGITESLQSTEAEDQSDHTEDQSHAIR